MNRISFVSLLFVSACSRPVPAAQTADRQPPNPADTHEPAMAAQTSAWVSRTELPSRPTAQSEQEVQAEIFHLGEHKFTLPSEGSHCHLARDDAKRYPLKSAVGCKFHRDSQGEVRVLTRDGWSYFLVENSEPIAGTRNCETTLQAVRVKAEQVEISPHLQRLAMCRRNQWESYVFFEVF